MDNLAIEQKPILNDNGDQIIEEKIDGAGKTQTIKYGLIKLMGDKSEYRVSYKTLLGINKAKNSNFMGQINIPEIRMSVQASQIAMLKSETEDVRLENNIANLPTETVFLDENFNRLIEPKPVIEREHDIYCIATCHYVVVDGEKQYYLAPEQIQYLVTMVRDEDSDCPHYIKKATKYGRDVREIQKEQNEQHSKRR